MLAALIATIAGIAYAGLTPLEFRPPNEVEWVDPGPGLRFGGRGIAYGSEPLRWMSSPDPGEISVELWLEPAEEPGDRMRQVFAIFDATGREPFLIAQWKSGLVVRARVPEAAGGLRYRELGTLGLLFRDQLRYVAVTSGAAGTAVFVDGDAIEDRTNIPLVAAGEDFGGRIVLGNSSTGTAPWRGVLLGVAVYDRSLAGAEIAEHHVRVRERGVSALSREAGLVALYPFDRRSGRAALEEARRGPALRVPLRFERLRTEVLQLATGRGGPSGAFLRDVILNWLAFVPLGFFAVVAYRRHRPDVRVPWVLCAAVALCGSLSLAIELIQVQLPDRVSSATDLICNLTGGAVGALFAWRGPVARRLFPPRC